RFIPTPSQLYSLITTFTVAGLTDQQATTQEKCMTTQSPSTPNVDTQEIAKFEALADTWWDPSGEFGPLHEINPLRLNYIDDIVSLPGKTVVDIGCGGGLLSEGMALRGANVTGIDMGAAPLEVARQHAKQTAVEIEYLQIPAEELAAQRPAHYDVVTCLEMLEHVPDPAAIVKACAALVKPGGHVIF